MCCCLHISSVWIFTYCNARPFCFTAILHISSVWYSTYCNNNSTKLRYLLNSDILTPINTANLLNSSDNHKNGNSNNSNNNKRVLESKDEIDENKLDNNENINKKQKIDDSTHILN